MYKKYKKKEERQKLAKQIAAEGIVMLRNKNQVLPLRTEKMLAMFGLGQINTAISGGGSGAAISKDATNILDEMKKAGFCFVQEIESYYRAVYALRNTKTETEDMHANFADLVSSGIIYEIFGTYNPPEEEPKLSEDLLEIGKIETDTAVCVITRVAGGEECDRRVENDYYLLESERNLINQVAKNFVHVIVILNINGYVDTAWLNDYDNIEGVLYIGTPGEQGAMALAEIVSGRQIPSGKLSATMAMCYEDYPSAKHFSSNKDNSKDILTYGDYGLSAEDNGSIDFSMSPVTVYKESIYVGYRYFDSFNKKVMFPFGYGLSYAEFSMNEKKVDLRDGFIKMQISIQNQNKQYTGKEVIQVYVSAPEGRLEKPYQEFITCVKTKQLEPGEKVQVKMQFPISELASYDEERACYVLEPGEYYIRVGNSSRNTHIIGKLVISEEVITRRLNNRLVLNTANTGKISFLSAKGVISYHYDDEETEKKETSLAGIIGQKDIVIQTIGYTKKTANLSGPKSKLIDVKEGHVSMKEFVSQLTDDELAVLVNGYGPGLPFGGMGGQYPNSIRYKDGENIAISTHKSGNLGYVSPALIKYGIPSAFYKDGPAGVGMIAWPTSSVMACTFNIKLLYAFGEAGGTEAEMKEVDSWLTPAVNLQRNPIGGRNFEYYSEDPRLCGLCGLYVAKGVEENSQVTVCPKHFALNEQETYRRGSRKKNIDALDSIVQERVARELYLKPFEMVITGTDTSTIMSSFNKINGIFAAGNKDLCTNILREEWGYEGVVVTDWGDMDYVVHGADAVAAGNDVIMPGGPPVIAQIQEGLATGRVKREELIQAVSNLLYFVIHSKSFKEFNES